jgi:hypothetical protein
VLSSLLETLLEVDEIKSEPLPDGRLQTTFLTTCISEDFAKLKTMIWALVAPPAQKVDSVNLEVLQAGPLTKRVRITVVTRPLLGSGKPAP